MMESYTFMNNRKIDCKWTIKNFTDYFNISTNEQRHVLQSSIFDFMGLDDYRFYLRMIFYPTSITCFFHLRPCTEFQQLLYQISILDKNNEKFRTLNGKCYPCNSPSYTDEFPTLQVRKEDLFNRELDLFPDNNLTVVCNLIFYYGDINSRQIFTPRPYPSIKDHFRSLLNSQNGSDVVFEVDDEEFNVHKSILMARSPVFSAMFNSDMTEKITNRVKIEDISASIFKLLIEFIYTDEIPTELDVKTGTDLLKAASKYQLEGLEALCEAELFHRLSVKNAVDILLVAELHKLVKLEHYIKEFVKINREGVQNTIKPEHFLKYPHHVFLFFA